MAERGVRADTLRRRALVLAAAAVAVGCSMIAGLKDAELAPSKDGGADAGTGGTGATSGGGSAGSGATGGAAAGAGGTTSGGGVAGMAGMGGMGGIAGATGGAAGSGTGGATGSKYADAVLADGPVGYWRLGESSGTTAADSSGNGNDGVIKGTTKLGEPGALSGDPDTAFYFDGSGNSYVDIGDKLDFAGTQPFSMEAWIYPQTKDRGFFGKGAYVNGYEGWFLAEGGGVLQFYRDNTPCVTPEISETEYTYVAATFDGLNWAIYLNGSAAVSKAATNPVTNHPDPVTIGMVTQWNTMIGWIDEVAVYDKALTATQVKAHYDAGKGL